MSRHNHRHVARRPQASKRRELDPQEILRVTFSHDQSCPTGLVSHARSVANAIANARNAEVMECLRCDAYHVVEGS